MSQSHGSGLWQEPAGNGATPTLTSMHFVDDGLGGLAIEDVPVGNPTAARMFADADGGFTVTDGEDNPGALAELEMVAVLGAIVTY